MSSGSGPTEAIIMDSNGHHVLEQTTYSSAWCDTVVEWINRLTNVTCSPSNIKNGLGPVDHVALQQKKNGPVEQYGKAVW
jgi:hypothetical protein